MRDKPLLVLIHGWGSDASVWADVVGQLEGDFDVMTPELPGHGNSRIETGEINHVVEAIGEQVQRPAYWLGWSLGALLAMQAAMAIPGKVKALLLVSATPTFIQSGEWQTAMPEGEFDIFQRNFEENPHRTLARFMALQARGDVNAKSVLKQLKNRLAGKTSDISQMAWGLAVLKSTDIRPELRDISQPLSVLHGANDEVVPVGAAKYLAGIHGSDLQVWDGTGHAPFLSRPARFVGWVREAVA